MLRVRVRARRRLRDVLLVTTLLGCVLNAVPASATSGAPYAFEQTQGGRSSQPVGWNPCRTIPVRVNLADAPRHSMRLVRQALADVQGASGIRLVLAGRSHRATGFLHRYGVLVSWTTPGHAHALAGGTVGLGSSRWRQRGDGLRHYTRGAALLDGPALRRMGRAKRLAVLEHELGHVMGLAHVRDRSQLMFPVIGRQRGYGSGDVAGLAALGQLPCG